MVTVHFHFIGDTKMRCYTIYLYILLLLLPIPLHANDMSSTSSSLVEWIDQHTKYMLSDVPSDDLPTIVMVDYEELDSRFGKLTYGVYVVELNIIMMSSAVSDLSDVTAESILVHEMIHFLQHYEELNNMRSKPRCPAEYEHEAYNIQREYMEYHNEEFQYDPVLLALLTRCFSRNAYE